MTESQIISGRAGLWVVHHVHLNTIAFYTMLIIFTLAYLNGLEYSSDYQERLGATGFLARGSSTPNRTMTTRMTQIRGDL